MERNLSNTEILDIYLKNGLIQTCIDCQFVKVVDKRNKEDFFQDLCLIILEYDNKKLNTIHKENHFNAFVTGIIVRNIFSVNSPFYKNYFRQNNREREITAEDYNISDETEY